MQPTYFINHGGGPCFFFDPGPHRDMWAELEAYLRGFAGALDERPRAILIVSGHWEEVRPTVNAGAAPKLLFDYGGFPAHTYRLTWPALGAPDLAARVRDLLAAAGIESGSDAARGWHHGVFVPMKVMFPGADMPTVQLSLQHGLDPATHLAIGAALTPLREEGVLIIGSGQTYHNMRGFGGDGGRVDAAEAFDAWLRSPTRTDTTMSQLPTDGSNDPMVRSIMSALTASYASLAAPRYALVYTTMAGPVHRNLIAELRRRDVGVLETTDENDDVSTQLVVSQFGDQVGLGLSGVGRFAALVHQGEAGRYFWVTHTNRPKH